MDKEYKSDFEFKDERQYVHSSSQIEGLMSHIYSNKWIDENWKNPKLDARFHKEIRNNGIFRFSEDKELIVKSESVSSSFTLYDNKNCIYAVLVENENDNILRRINTKYKVGRIELTDKFCGSCTIDCQNQKAFVENIIEVNKRIHQKTLNSLKVKVKIVNLYVRRLPVSFPIDGMKNSKEIKLNIKNMSYRDQDRSILTLNSLSFPEENIDIFDLAFSVQFL